MSTIDTVVPNSLNYTDIKPQAIENNIVLVKYQPSTYVDGQKQGDMVKFLLSGNGFLDPYSTYLQFTVECTDLGAAEIRTVDRSAHSFISRMIIRSYGVELERIENYDIIAAMINDMIYSPEQYVLHHWEGFPTSYVDTAGFIPSGAQMLGAGVGEVVPADMVGEHNPQNYLPYCPSRDYLARSSFYGSTPRIYEGFGEVAFHRDILAVNAYDAPGLPGVAGPYDRYVIQDELRATEMVALGMLPDTSLYNAGADASVQIPIQFAYHLNGRRIPATTGAANSAYLRYRPHTKYQFLIPIYSGVIGLLMPEKKLIPLNLLPLDIEIYLNPHALYTDTAAGNRNYRITSFNLFAHVINFEQEIHRTLEASVADHGLFIYCNSFHSAPQYLIANKVIPTVAPISMNLKSINSVHFLFMYSHFETTTAARKLHFVSHNITSVQLCNGVTLIPYYAIEGYAGSSNEGYHLPFIVELYKAWNKMHDPTTDGIIHSSNFCGDEYAGQFDAPDFAITNEPESRRTLLVLANKYCLVGRCQYGISLEGEELGSDRTMITGRKSQYPFHLLLKSSGKYSEKTSYMYTFLRADFIVYIRPDLQIVTLGK